MEYPARWTPRTIPAIRRQLLRWFDANCRNLPWRQDRDPYRIWVSEVMLQQTTVKAVIPFFERFIAAFPDVKTLAEASEDDVLRLWSGLGYYRRAKHLHQAAQQLVRASGRRLPDDPDLWAGLPGVGRYILGAVLSQAFDRRLPIVEANSLRVLSRLFGYREDPRSGAGQKWVWHAAEVLLPTRRVGDFNQALMELGSLLCTPIAPTCKSCPIRTVCEANRLGLQRVIPPKAVAKAITDVREVAVAMRDNEGRVLLCQRPPEARRWANMWEIPHGEMTTGEEDTHAARRLGRELTGFDVNIGPEVCTIRHGITRSMITMTCLEATIVGGEFVPGTYRDVQWVDPASATRLPMSSPQRKLLAELGRGNHQRRLF